MTKLVKSIMALVLAGGLVSTTTAKGPKGDSIVDVAIAVNSEGDFAGEFDTLIAALGAADPAVIATLDGNGQHTVFAPTDLAFQNTLGLSTNNIDSVSSEVLTDVLLYHVAKGRRDSGDVLDSRQIRTLLREFVEVDATNVALIDNNGNSADIIFVDVPAANGIIHVIDAVLLP